MAEITKAAFNTTYADSAGVFADNTTGLISEGDLRAFATDIKDSLAFNLDGAIKRIKVTVSSASLLTLGTVPVQIIAAPGANKYLAIHKIFISFKYNSVAFDYSAAESTIFKWTSTNAGYEIDYTQMNGTTDFNMFLANISVSGSVNLKFPTNQALLLSTSAGTDPTVGNSDLDVVVYYSIEDVNV